MEVEIGLRRYNPVNGCVKSKLEDAIFFNSVFEEKVTLIVTKTFEEGKLHHFPLRNSVFIGFLPLYMEYFGRFSLFEEFHYPRLVVELGMGTAILSI